MSQNQKFMIAKKANEKSEASKGQSKVFWSTIHIKVSVSKTYKFKELSILK